MYFVDAAHFVQSAYLGWLWCFVRTFVLSSSGRQRFNVWGFTKRQVLYSRHLAVGKDTASPRWRKLFAIAVSRFVRQALSKQVRQVNAWLAQADEPVLKKHRATLHTWADKADAALTQTAALALARGEAWSAFEQLAEDLTRERDGLRDALAAIARHKGLPRTWPDLFFRVEHRGRAMDEEPDPPVEPPAAPAASPPHAPSVS